VSIGRRNALAIVELLVKDASRELDGSGAKLGRDASFQKPARTRRKISSFVADEARVCLAWGAIGH
jgi:hypothetical protein